MAITDYLSLVETAPNEGYLTINFEYISGGTWMETYPLVIGNKLPFAELIAAVEPQSGEINAFDLKDTDNLKKKIRQVSTESLIDLGLGIISVKRNVNGQWERTYSDADRRVTGISGLDKPERALKSTGAAVAVFTKPNKMGYEDDLGDRIIGTFQQVDWARSGNPTAPRLQNCSGGTTPWGTVLSAEENYQDQVPEAVMADGSSLLPQAMPFAIGEVILAGAANVFGLAGNKYGWMVEIDPANPDNLTLDKTGNAYPFAIGPMECECTGITFDRDNTNLFLSVQHPGEKYGIRRNMATELKDFELLTTDAEAFKQQRQVPIGSNWPSDKANQPPLPVIVTIRRKTGNQIV